MINRGANVNVLDDECSTPLHKALQSLKDCKDSADAEKKKVLPSNIFTSAGVFGLGWFSLKISKVLAASLPEIRNIAIADFP